MSEIEFTYLPIETDLSFIQVRSVKYWGVERLKKSMQERGFLDGKPIEVARVNGSLRLFEGRHRWEAAKLSNIDKVPALVHDGLPDQEQYRRAYLANDSAEDAVPKTFMDDAEMIWGRLHDGWTQEKVAETFGWTRPKVAQYAQLEKICPEARQFIVTDLDQNSNKSKNGDVTEDVTAVTKSKFSEYLLRPLVLLTPLQQVDLVNGLIKGRLGKEDQFDKAKFRAMAERYQGRNAMLDEAEKRLSAMPDEHLTTVKEEINKAIQTVYDKEWIEHQKHLGPKFEQLIEHELKLFYKAQLFDVQSGDFREILPSLTPESIDVILTDPPYSQEFLGLYADLAKLANFVLKPGGSLLVMCGQSYLPEIFAAMTPHIRYYWTISYDTPGGQATTIWQRNKMNSFWKPVLWFVKGDYHGNSQSDKAASAVNDNDKRFHEWGQSESGMLTLVERFTQPGDKILDPMMGAGTTGIAAVLLKREFLGIDKDTEKVETALKRLTQIIEITPDDSDREE